METSKEDKKRQQEYQAEDDLRTLKRYSELIRDSARMARVRAAARKEAEALDMAEQAAQYDAPSSKEARDRLADMKK